MAIKDISNPHKATIKRHLEESLQAGVPLDEIHRELGEIFKEQGKYSMSQITGTTSWILSEILSNKRTTPIDWDEMGGKKRDREDTNFDNPAKNDSRAWHMGNVVKHTTSQQRKTMHYSVLPGKNTYDFQALVEIGVPCRNLVTFILGEDPQAVAQYLRNCRQYGVAERKVGRIIDQVSTVEKPLEGLYWDYFSQFCPGVVKDLWSVPLPSHSGPIPIGINLLKGREHGSTGDLLREWSVRKKLASMTSYVVNTMESVLTAYFGDHDEKIDKRMGLDNIRDELVQPALLARVGVANTKNWVLEDAAVRLINQNFELFDEPTRYDDLTNIEKVIEFEEVMLKVVAAFSLIQSQTGVDADFFMCLPALASGTALAVLNRPLIRKVETPKEYISPEKNRPFVSYFGVLETNRSHYLKHVNAMKFLFDIAHHILPLIHASSTGKNGGRQEQLGATYFDGIGRKKKVVFACEHRIIASISADALQTAAFELLAPGLNALSGNVEDQHVLLQEAKRNAIGNSDMSDLLSLVGPSSGGTFRRMGEKDKRNQPCSCGSGKKFKKCCGGH